MQFQCHVERLLGKKIPTVHHQPFPKGWSCLTEYMLQDFTPMAAAKTMLTEKESKYEEVETNLYSHGCY